MKDHQKDSGTAKFLKSKEQSIQVAVRETTSPQPANKSCAFYGIKYSVLAIDLFSLYTVILHL